MNDHDGHEAGDRLLIQAGELLGKVFYHDDIFRTGGDEFIVITDGISYETFARKMLRLRRDAEKNGGFQIIFSNFAKSSSSHQLFNWPSMN